MSKKTRYIVHCVICNKECFEYPNYPRKYCSKTCLYEGRKTRIFTKEWRENISKGIKNNLPSTAFKKGNSPWNKGIDTPKREFSCHWKGGRRKHCRGYIEIYSPEHPFKNKQNYVLEHRLVMEKHIGRYLTPNEVVHHINRITDDNRIENLILFENHSKHMLHHVKEK